MKLKAGGAACTSHTHTCNLTRARLVVATPAPCSPSLCSLTCAQDSAAAPCRGKLSRPRLPPLPRWCPRHGRGTPTRRPGPQGVRRAGAGGGAAGPGGPRGSPRGGAAGGARKARRAGATAAWPCLVVMALACLCCCRPAPSLGIHPPMWPRPRPGTHGHGHPLPACRLPALAGPCSCSLTPHSPLPHTTRGPFARMHAPAAPRMRCPSHAHLLCPPSPAPAVHGARAGRALRAGGPDGRDGGPPGGAGGLPGGRRAARACGRGRGGAGARGVLAGRRKPCLPACLKGWLAHRADGRPMGREGKGRRRLWRPAGLP